MSSGSIVEICLAGFLDTLCIYLLYVVTIEFRVNLMAENETTLTCAKPSYLRMKLWKVENGVSSTEPPETGCVSYGPDEETTHTTTHNAGNFNFTY